MSRALALPQISKLVATGNDFVFVNALDELPSGFEKSARPELARKLCDRHNGLGGDGLVFVERGAASSRFKWDFYNSDGSAAEMCGNATRCFGRWIENTLHLHEAELETTAGLVHVRAEKNEVFSELPFVQVNASSFTTLAFALAGKSVTATLINTGVPHAVFEIDRIEDAAAQTDVIQALRFHPLTGPRGANVTFVARKNSGQFETVTFERGVEDFTLSCGTGVLAAAAVGLRKTGGEEAELSTPGGTLHVKYRNQGAGVILSGPAKYLFTATLTEELFK